MTKNDAIKVAELLKQAYPDATCSLDFTTPFEIVVAVMLSAQCTDERVNKVTPALFERCKSIEDFANIDTHELEQLIHSCGFYKNKAKNIKLCAKQVLENFGGVVPQTMDELLTLAGVGRKSANVVLLEAFGIANGVAVDTHAKRIANRLALSQESAPEKIEQDLIRVFPKEYLKELNHLLVWHGRRTCSARNPRCGDCVIKDFCKSRRLTKQLKSKFSDDLSCFSSFFYNKRMLDWLKMLLFLFFHNSIFLLSERYSLVHSLCLSSLSPLVFIMNKIIKFMQLF